MTKPITYFEQNPATEALSEAYGSNLQRLDRDHLLCTVVALSTAMVTGGSFLQCLLDVEEFVENPLPELLLEIAVHVDIQGCSARLLEGVVHQIANPVEVVSVASGWQ